MTNLDNLRKTIDSALGETPSADTCVRLAEALLTLAPKESQYLTFTTFQKLLNKKEIDLPLVSAVYFLTSSRHSILSAHGQFIDDNGDEYPLDDLQFKQVIKTNTVVHPQSGEIVEDANSQVSPYFVLDWSCLENDIANET